MPMSQPRPYLGDLLGKLRIGSIGELVQAIEV